MTRHAETLSLELTRTPDILAEAGGEERLPVMTKYEVARRILDRVVELLAKGS